MRIIFFDLETAGLDCRKHPIIQIGAVVVDDNLEEAESFERKLTFDVTTADSDALEINGYDKSEWQLSAVSPKTAVEDFSKFLGRYADIERISKSGNPYFVAQLAGYNAASFDFPFVQELYKKHNAFLPASYGIMDVYHRAMWYFFERKEKLGSLRLSVVADHFGVKPEKLHDALSDARTTLAVYRKMMESK